MTSFDTHQQRYEAWFTSHKAVYHFELLAVRALLPWQGPGLEISLGTGGFVVVSATAPSGQTLRAAVSELKKQS